MRVQNIQHLCTMVFMLKIILFCSTLASPSGFFPFNVDLALTTEHIVLHVLVPDASHEKQVKVSDPQAMFSKTFYFVSSNIDI